MGILIFWKNDRGAGMKEYVRIFWERHIPNRFSYKILEYTFSTRNWKLEVFVALGILTMVGIITWIVYVTGGAQYAWSHLLYIPILFSCFRWGWKGGIAVACISALAVGPFMPVNTYTGEMQAGYNWLIRLLVFSIIGWLFGLILGWVKDSTRRLILYNQQLSDVYYSFLMSMVNTLEARDPYTRFHSQKVALLSVLIGKRLGLEPAQLSELFWAAILHDLGKVGVPNEILLKEGPLERDEWEVMKGHSLVAEEIIKPVPFLSPLLKIIRSHHEKWDGSGYPDGLAEEAIPFLARIITVADVFDAMLSDRPYHKAGDSIDIVKEYIVRNKGILFDPAVVDTLERLDTGLLDRIRNIEVLNDLESVDLSLDL